MKINESKYGFVVKKRAEVSELNATMYEMEHIKTHLKLAWLKRDEENKTFGIAFKTLPSDDSGVFHILEHSVLCGSKKYPVKEPFVELMKSSMSTFLNALTFEDKTFYPISSRNNQDFMNLTKVYLDAVFNPLILNKKEIFLQEELLGGGESRSNMKKVVSKSDLERENERLRKELNQLKVKEVEKQQTQFGVGIND
mgnify:CR=1 FL=1